MDPLSITASAITIAEVCVKLSSGIRTIRSLSQVSEEFAALSDELSDFQNVLVAVCTVLRQRSITVRQDASVATLESFLVKAKLILSETSKLCGITTQQCTALDGENHLLSTGDDATSLDFRSRWRWIKDRKKIEQHRKRLEVVRLDIANYLATMSLIDSLTARTDMQELTTAFRRMNTDRTEYMKAMANILMKAQEENLPQDFHNHFNLPNPAITGLSIQQNTIVPSNSTLKEPHPEASFTSELLPILQSPSIGHDGNDTWRRRSSCSHPCSCSCHQFTRFSNPTWTHILLGNVDVRINGLLNTPKCDESTCKRRSISSFKLTYRFPSWILNKVIGIILQNDQLGGPQVSLSCARIVPRESDVFRHAIQGKIKSIQELFSSGCASPYDMSHDYGWTALHFAVNYGHLELCDFLIKAAGAHCNLMDFENQTPADIAYHRIHFRKIDWSSRKRLQDLFDEEEWLEQKQFTVLHKLVLQLVSHSSSLEDQLLLSTKAVNEPDTDGRSPLSWAAERGDKVSATSLIQYGADPNLRNKDGNTPLHYACKALGPEVVAVLRQADADGKMTNNQGQTPLDWAAFFQNDTRFAEELLQQNGVDVNASSKQGTAPINNAAFRSHPAMLEYLIRAGADINHQQLDGKTPLFDSIALNHHEILRILLEFAKPCGLNVAVKNGTNETCLHYLAKAADAETAEIFLRAVERGAMDITGLSTIHVGKEGRTARDILETRTDYLVTSTVEKILRAIERETLD